jgi:probable O-glycosylation ligase (exosortase A-associated)
VKGLVLTYIITILGTIAAFRYPLIGLQVYVGLAVLRPQSIFGFAGDLSNLSLMVGIAVLIGWTIQGFGSWNFGRGRFVVSAFSLFVLWFVISSTQALQPGLSFESFNELLKFVVPFFVGVTLMKDEKDWRPMLWTIVLCQGYVGLEMHINYMLKGYNTAAEGFGGMDNNCFGASLLTVLGPAVALMISSRTWTARALAAISAALILHTILLTFSRGAMVGLLAVGLTAFVLMPKRPKYLGALVLTVTVALYFTGPQLWERYASTFAPAEERDGSAESRVELWKSCIEVIKEYPLFGVGPANWRVISDRYGWPPGKSAHSVWMETSAELGLPGGLLLLLFFAGAAIKLWPIARARLTEANHYQVVLAQGVVLSIVGFSVAGQFVSVPGLEVPYYVTMLGAAMLKGTPRSQRVEAAEPSRPWEAAAQGSWQAARFTGGSLR